MKEGERKKEMILYTQIAVLFIIIDVAIIVWSSYDWIGIPAKHEQMSPAYEEFAVHIAETVKVGRHLNGFESLEYGDVVFYMFSNATVESDKDNLFFSRVVGLPGDTVGIKNGRLIRNGNVVDESHVAEPNINPEENFPEMLVPRDHVYLLHDKRNSIGKYLYLSDSRYFGPISMHVIKGILGRN